MIREQLAGSDKGNTQWQRDLSVSFNRIGDVLVSAGERSKALEHYQRVLVIAEQLAVSDKGNTQWQTDVVVSLWKLGGMTEVVTDAARRQFLERGLSIWQDLKNRNGLTPSQEGWGKLFEDALKK